MSSIKNQARYFTIELKALYEEAKMAWLFQKMHFNLICTFVNTFWLGLGLSLGQVVHSF